MLLLVSTAAGYGLFRVDNKKWKKVDGAESVLEVFGTPEQLKESVSLTAFKKFKKISVAFDEGVALRDGNVGKQLKKFIKKNVVEESEKLLICDQTLN
eukprot:Trichotokara_eunicae@DN9121_c0_g1_i1.p1